MRLDLEGHLIVGGRFLLPVSSVSSHNDGSTVVREDDLSCLPPWQKNMARLCQRVRDVQTMVQEDLGDLDEPITTLGDIARTLSHEHVTQWEAAKAAYSQAILECNQVLARILSPFTEKQEPLERRVDLADDVLSPLEAVSR